MKMQVFDGQSINGREEKIRVLCFDKLLEGREFFREWINGEFYQGWVTGYEGHAETMVRKCMLDEILIVEMKSGLEDSLSLLNRLIELSLNSETEFVFYHTSIITDENKQKKEITEKAKVRFLQISAKGIAGTMNISR